jgi:hypothetical protein
MSGGEISGNTASSGNGGGVYVGGGIFTMSSGEISGNTASSTSLARGGGVYVEGGTFTMSGGEISGNTAASSYSASGGGVGVGGGRFTMSGGEISGNTVSSSNASAYGGGVHVNSSGMFTKQSGGVIYGADASDTLKNTASGYRDGHAVYVYIYNSSSSDKKRNTTAGEGVTLDSAKTGAEGGWVESLPGNLSLNESLEWLSASAAEGGAYTITLSGNETVAPSTVSVVGGTMSTPSTLSYSGKTVSITLDGGAAERTVSLGSNGYLFTVGSGVTLKLGSNITLQGRSGNTAAVVLVNSGGTLEMNSGSKISGNTNASTSDSGMSVPIGPSTSKSVFDGGGVYINGGTFTMRGGEITGNSVSSYG